MTRIRIGQAKPRTVDLAAELIAAGDDISTIIHHHRTLPTGPVMRAVDLADDLATLAVDDREGGHVAPGEIHSIARRMVDITDLLDDYGPDDVACGVLGLTDAHLHRLCDALAVTPQLKAVG